MIVCVRRLLAVSARSLAGAVEVLDGEVGRRASRLRFQEVSPPWQPWSRGASRGAAASFQDCDALWRSLLGARRLESLVLTLRAGGDLSSSAFRWPEVSGSP